jgi:hypothetical protein
MMWLSERTSDRVLAHSLVVLLFAVGGLAGQPCSAQLTADERWQELRDEVVSPSLVMGGLSMGLVDYLRDDPASWRRGGVGYAIRSGSHAGRLVLEAGAAHGMAAATDLSLRYTARRTGGVGARLRHAVFGAVTARTATGRRVPNAPRWVAAYGAALAQHGWTHGDLRARDAAISSALSLGIDVVTTVVVEFAAE